MATWSFDLDFGGTHQDITSLVDIRSVKRTTTLFNEMNPTLNKLEFRLVFDATLFGRLIATKEAVATVLRNGSAHFTGALSPNYSTAIRDGSKFINLIIEDYGVSKLGQTITSLLAYSTYSVCDPASPSTSLVHALTTAAGVALAGSPPTISSSIPLLVVLPDDKATYATLLTQILFEYGYVYFFNPDGTLSLVKTVNTGAFSGAYFFSDAYGSGNIRGELEMSKKPDRYDDFRIKYRSVEYKMGIALFEDRSGASGSIAANISLAASGDAGKLDYYPKGSDAAEIFSDWKSPDGYTIMGADSCALDSTVDANITLSRSLTNYYKRASFAYHNGAGAAKLITKLRLIGNAWVVVSENTARVAAAGAKLLLEYEAKYIFATANAQALALIMRQYYSFSDITLSLKSRLDVPVGGYVVIQDAIYSGAAISARVIGKVEDESSTSISYSLEACDNYSTVAITTDGGSAPPSYDAWKAALIASLALTVGQSSGSSEQQTNLIRNFEWLDLGHNYGESGDTSLNLDCGHYEDSASTYYQPDSILDCGHFGGL